ncbi:hypothetical protein GCM10010872_41270 [Dyella flava]|nr:hypothetical protein GCM10010872_41270 [Dyella flava]
MHRTPPVAAVPKPEVVGDAEVVLSPQTTQAAAINNSDDVGDAELVLPPQAAKAAAMEVLDYVWWLAAAVLALIVLGMRWALRREASEWTLAQRAPALEEHPARQASAPVPDVPGEAMPATPATPPVKMEPVPAVAAPEAPVLNPESLSAPEITSEAVPVMPATSPSEMESIPTAATPMATVLNPAFFEPRTTVQITVTPSHRSDMASAPVRDLRRARLLLQRGELGQALTPIASFLRDLQRERPAEESPGRPGLLPDPLYLDNSHPVSRLTAALHADIRWRLARQSRSDADHVQAICALETYLSFRSQDMAARLRLGHCLLHLAGREKNAAAQASLLHYCIDILRQPFHFEAAHQQLLLALLGEALCRRTLQDSVIDQHSQAEAEDLLRQAIAMGPMPGRDATWWLQKSLTTTAAGMQSDLEPARLNEAIALLQDAVEATVTRPEHSRWLAALLRAELKEAHLNPASVLALRLRLRELHARYAGEIQTETSPTMLAAWVDLLCAMATPLTGAAAQARYGEVDAALDRLSTHDADGGLYASAWIHMAQGRLRVESCAGRRDLLQRAESLLAPHLDGADPALCVEAGELAHAQASQEEDLQERNAACARALAFVRPALGSTSPLAARALRCALKAALALQHEEERRVLAADLSRLAPEDTESLGLLAASASQDGMPADACGYLERAAQGSKALPDDLLELWKHASVLWASQCGNDAAWQVNQHQLRFAENRRGRGRPPVVDAHRTVCVAATP